MVSQTYKGMYECDCENLTRRLPFRTVFTKHVINDLQRLFPDPKQKLVYTTQGPGGLLFDYILINKLIDAGYNNITVVIIEELYKEKLDIVQACLDFKQWCCDRANKATLIPHFFTSLEEHAQACIKNPELKGHLMITVDADDKKTVPNFDSLEFRKQFVHTAQTTMRPKGSFYYLLHQNNQRHMIIGRIHQHPEFIIAYQHSYGVDSLSENQRTRLFLNTEEILPFNSIPNGVQIDGKVIITNKLSRLLEFPLSDPEY